ncbi:MAG: exo-alpha-sialidase [Patescibacteria group bacterium]
MKRIFAFIFFLVLTGCQTTPEDDVLLQNPVTEPETELETEESTMPEMLDIGVNDFEPPSDVERGMGDAGPYEMRLLSAHSEDGITWERDSVIISEQANVPDMMVTEDGTIFLYYVGGNIQAMDETLAAAVSQDGGETWTFKKVAINGFTQTHATPGDPDIALRDDGTFRLYFTSHIKGDKMPSIQYADSTDGLNFTYGGKAFSAEGYMTIDSSAFYINGQWMMNTFSGFGTEVITGSSNDDGDTFDFVQAENVTYKKQAYFLSNPLSLEDGSVRFYSFQLHPSGFRSFITTDGLTWADEGRVYLEYKEGENELEGYYIKDPVVVQLPDDTYLMVYVTRAP